MDDVGSTPTGSANIFERMANEMFRWLINLVRPPFVSAKLNKWKALRDAKRQDFLENYYTRIDED